MCTKHHEAKKWSFRLPYTALKLGRRTITMCCIFFEDFSCPTALAVLFGFWCGVPGWLVREVSVRAPLVVTSCMWIMWLWTFWGFQTLPVWLLTGSGQEVLMSDPVQVVGWFEVVLKVTDNWQVVLEVWCWFRGGGFGAGSGVGSCSSVQSTRQVQSNRRKLDDVTLSYLLCCWLAGLIFLCAWVFFHVSACLFTCIDI